MISKLRVKDIEPHLDELKAACELPAKEFVSLENLYKNNPQNNIWTIICGSFYMLNEVIPDNFRSSLT